MCNKIQYDIMENKCKMLEIQSLGNTKYLDTK